MPERALIALLLLFVYRSLPALLLGLVPVALGALGGHRRRRAGIRAPCTASRSDLGSP